MSRPLDAKSPIAFALPDKPWQAVRNRGRWRAGNPHKRDSVAAAVWRASWLPPLQSLEFELAVLRALLVKPEKDLLYSKYYVPAKNRLIGFQRLAQVALREGHSPASVATMLVTIYAESLEPTRSDSYLCTPQDVVDLVDKIAAGGTN